MSITNWKTWASGDVLTAADMNTYDRDNGRWLSHNATGGAPTCRVYGTAQSGITTTTAIAFDHETFDLGGMHDTVTNNSRLTVPTGGGGTYLVTANIRYSIASSAGDISLQLRVNGAAPPVNEHKINTSAASITTIQALSFADIVQLSAADYIELFTVFTTYASVDIGGSNGVPNFSAVWIGE